MVNGYNWYAVYTKSRQEKKLTARLNDRGIEAYTPVRKTLKQWSDRKKLVEEVLVRSYVFVHIPPSSYDMVLNNPGAVRFVWFGGKPAVIPANQIAMLKLVTGTGEEITPVTCDLAPGQPVKVIAGPFAGVTGELVSIDKKDQFVIRIDHISTMLSLAISPHFLEMVP